ncbi:molybdate transport system substrate-binding protein [Candidatus Magnetomoraceae bacterium gMMP-1]
MKLRCFMFMISLITIFTLMKTADAKEEIIVSAAASLTNAMTKVAQIFEEKNSDIKVVLNFASSGSLLQQMIHGAPVDVFASANQKFMNTAQEKNLILPNTRKNFVQNKLVLAVPADSKLKLNKISDLLMPEVKKISLGNPDHVPAGRYARESLKAYGLWDKLADKFIFANSVRQVLDYLSRKEVDAGLFYSTDAKIGGNKVKVKIEIDKHHPIIYPIAVLASSMKVKSATYFINFVLSEQGQKIFAEFAFHKP